MNVLRSEKLESLEGEVGGDIAAATEVEAGIREFVRNDIAYLRRPAFMNNAEPALEPGAEAAVNNVNSLIQRVAGTSLSEIEHLISELEDLRDLLHAEGQRVQRELSGYAQLSQAAMQSTRTMAENVAQWKRTAEGLRHSGRRGSEPAFRRIWLANPELAGLDLRGIERISAVGIALYDHRGRQHDRNRHGCEDKANQSQSPAIRH